MKSAYNNLAPSNITSVTNMVVLDTRTTIGFNICHINYWQFHLPTHNRVVTS